MMTRFARSLPLLVAFASALALASCASAQLAVSANDGKVRLVNGAAQTVPNPPPDTVSIIDLKASPPRVVAELPVPTSVVGPPFSVALTPDGKLALVTAAERLDPRDATKRIPDSRVTVIDLESSPPRVVGSLEAGAGAAGVSINRAGDLALVANRAEGTVSVFGIFGTSVTPLDKITLGPATAGVSHVMFTPDGKTALATRDGDDRIAVLSVTGSKVEYTKRDLNAGIRPYGLDIASTGAVAVVANIGRGQGDSDTISLIDMQAKPMRVVETITVGQTPEGIKLSPDGKLCAVAIMNGSNKVKDSPFYNERGKLLLYRIEGTRLVKAAEAPIGVWSQGIAFSADGRTLLVQNMADGEISVLSWDGTALKDTGARIKVKGGPAAIRTAEP
jgi:DNA-binding beta-propeller fold protein YncE